MRATSVIIACALVNAGCGSAGSSANSHAASPSQTPPLARQAQALCAGWVRHDAPGGTSVAFPGRAHEEREGSVTSFVYGEGDVYLQVDERVFRGMEGGSDRAAIDGFLAGLGDPAEAQLQEGWRVVSQGPGELDGRPTAERVIDIQGQVTRRERIVRAGPTMLLIATMVRNDLAEASAETLRCFERALVFAAPPAP